MSINICTQGTSIVSSVMCKIDFFYPFSWDDTDSVLDLSTNYASA